MYEGDGHKIELEHILVMHTYYILFVATMYHIVSWKYLKHVPLSY